jgi:hypothetical protein
MTFVDNKSSSITGSMKDDVNLNDAGDAPLPPVTVELLMVVTNGAVVLYSEYMNTTTDSAPPGNTLVEYTPNCFIEVTDSNAGDKNAISIDATCKESLDNKFVDRGRPLGLLYGTVFEVANGDDTGDVPLDGVMIVPKDVSGKVVAMTATDSMGEYKCINLPAGIGRAT